MLSLQTSNDDLCWLVGLCPRSRTASSIQGQSVLGRDGGSPAAPAVRPCRGLLIQCHVPGNKGDRRPAKDSDTSHTATWDHPLCCSVVLVSHADGLKGELHCAALRGSPHNHRRYFYPIRSGTAPFIPLKFYLFVPYLVLSPKDYIYTARLLFPLFFPIFHPIIPWLILPPNQFYLLAARFLYTPVFTSGVNQIIHSAGKTHPWHQRLSSLGPTSRRQPSLAKRRRGNSWCS